MTQLLTYADPVLVLLWTVAASMANGVACWRVALLRSSLSLVSLGLVILPYVGQPFQYCVQADFNRAFLESCRLIICAIRVSENWGRLRCVSLNI